jgi:amidohydrolase
MDTDVAGIRPAVRAIADDIVALRRDLHEHAELSTKEVRTQRVIIDRLEKLGLEDVRLIADTGVTALIRGARPGANVLWRADTDGLPLTEETGLPFASREQAMHACGHDGHVAIAVAIATVLQASRATMAGSVRLAFQPAEEHVGGARRMIDEGVMRAPTVDRVFGLHIWASTPVGHVLVQPGPVFAAATHFRIIVRGRGGHAAAPHETVDPIVVAAHVVTALQSVVSRGVSPDDAAVLTIGRIEGGVRGNIIPNEVMMSGTIRTFEKSVLERVLARATEIVRGVTSAFGAEHQFDTSTLAACVNDPAAAALVESQAMALLGADRVGVGRTTGGDDMAYFLEAAPGAYFMLGGGNRERGITWPHHHPKFDFDEACLPIGVELGLRVIEAAVEAGSRAS